MTTTLCTLNDTSLPISQLSSVEKLSASDLFIVERLDKGFGRSPTYQEGHNRYSYEEEVAGDIIDSILLEFGTTPSNRILYNELVGTVLEYIHSNGKISYDQLSSRIFQDISCKFNFNTMAFRDSYEYSKSSHSHKNQYADTRVFPRYTPEDIFQSSKNTLRVVSWDINHCANSSIQDIANVLKKLNADVYCLQDVDQNVSRSGNINQLEQLRVLLGANWKKFFSKTVDSGQSGLGILYTQTQVKECRCPISPTLDDDEQRIVQAIEFDDYVVANTKLAEKGKISDRVSQANSVISKLNSLGTKKPIWLCGNLNNVQNSEVLEALKSKYKIVSSTSGTSTTEFENQVVDYILMDSRNAEDKNRKFWNCRIAAEAKQASDHYPLVIDQTDITEQWLGDFTVWQLSGGEYLSTEVGVYIPPIVLDPYVHPDVGEVRFMGWNSAPTTTSKDSPLHVSSYSGTTLIADDSTSGWWCYCNGQTLTCDSNSFQDACKFFAGDANAKSFTLPSFNNFIMPNPRINTSSPLGFVKYENYLESHTHVIPEPGSSDEYSVKGQITIKSGRGGSGITNVHSGADFARNETPDYLTRLSCQIQYDDDGKIGLKTTSGITNNVGDDIESKPASNKLLAIAYLGGF